MDNPVGNPTAIAGDRLDTVIAARVHAARLVHLALIGLPVDALDLADLDRNLLEETLRQALATLTEHAVTTVGLNAARDWAGTVAQTVCADRRALRQATPHERLPDHVPPGWCDDAEEVMAAEELFVSLRLRPPTDRCSGCIGELPTSPPYLVDQLARRTFCDHCGIRAGYRQPVARLRQARKALDAARTDEQIRAAIALLDRRPDPDTGNSKENNDE